VYTCFRAKNNPDAKTSGIDLYKPLVLQKSGRHAVQHLLNHNRRQSGQCQVIKLKECGKDESVG
jgi:hypothetical protein